MKPEAIQQNLHQSVIFRDIDAEQLAEISANVQVRHVARGDFIHRRGDQSDTFYIVATGEVELTLQGEDGALSIVGRVGSGGHFGETSLLTRRPQSLTIRALCDVVLICLADVYFYQLLKQNRLVQERIECALAERLRISFHDHAASVLACDISAKKEIRLVDMMPLSERMSVDDEIDGQKDKVMRSQTAREIQAALEKFSADDRPVLLTGEPGTGRRLLAKQIHLQSSYAQGPYIEIDARDFNSEELARRLFGEKNDLFPFSQVRQTGVFEQFSRGTVTLHHLDRIPLPIQKKIADAIETLAYTRIGGERQIALEARIIFISDYSIDTLTDTLKIIRQLEKVLESAAFHVPALRFHKRDLPQLVDYYLHRFSREYGKNIRSVSPGTLGVLMNYDWPGNLTELSAVIQRAVMLARDDEILNEHILLGLPKSEGKWEFNLLRVPWIRTVLESRLYPVLPRTIVGTVLLAAVITLFFGPEDPEKNIGITLSWSIGWPLLFFSFFFMARTWCSVCTLAVPGTLLQSVIKPTRKTPEIIKIYSGWIMSALCIVVLWIEIVWNAYESPMLTGWIIVAISFRLNTFQCLFFSAGLVPLSLPARRDQRDFCNAVHPGASLKSTSLPEPLRGPRLLYRHAG